MASLDTSKIITYNFPEDQYYKEAMTKKRIILHWTAGGDNVNGVMSTWTSDAQRVATCVVLSRDGKIHQFYSSRFWAHSIGANSAMFNKFGLSNINTQLNKEAIAVEINSWGPLALHEGKFRSYVGTEVPASDVYTYETPFKTMPSSKYFDKIKVSNTPAKYYQKITDAQIASLEMLMLYWGEYYKIPLDYNEDIWTTTKRALSGASGVFTHNSYRTDKNDIDPQKPVIEMLKGLKNK